MRRSRNDRSRDREGPLGLRTRTAVSAEVLRSLALELTAFAALAWYVAAHWASGLVANAPGGRVFACVLIAVAVGVVLTLAGAAPPVRAWSLRCAGIVAGLGAGFVAIGLDARYLAPAHWDELGDGLDRGFAALGSAQWPYAGSEAWGTLVLLLAIPLVVTAAAAFAFWPNRALRPFAVVLLVALFGVAVTEHHFDGELGRGVGLLFFTAAWLWLPRMPERGARTAAAAAGAVLVACVAALPAAARYDDRDPLIDYQSWNPFAAHAATRFNWSHNYGPIDWPRDGTTLMYVKSNERHYWKVETLSLFEGDRWIRSGSGFGVNPLLPTPYNLVWETDFRVTIRDLNTNQIPIAGTALHITGLDADALASADGTIEVLEDPPDEGDTYSVEAYVPEPTPEQMRAADDFSALPTALLPYTQLGKLVPAYDRVARLARRLARGQPTTYDVVRAVQDHLRSGYVYDEHPPRRRHALAAFLFRDKAGYCQHFSGAMALMLRTLGLPARVAAGFTPGSYNADTKEYRVRDLDAHSWVEVWFNGIGWVPFDPTPSIAPAEAQSAVNDASASGGPAGTAETPDPSNNPNESQVDGGGAEGGAHPGGAVFEPWMAFAAIGLLAAGFLIAQRARRLLPHRGVEAEEAEIAVLRRVLARTGQPAAPRLTLRELESRLDGGADPVAARYLRMLRERRYGRERERMPDAVARRHLRRALARGRGVRARLGALVAMPPPLFRRG